MVENAVPYFANEYSCALSCPATEPVVNTTELQPKPVGPGYELSIATLPEDRVSAEYHPATGEVRGVPPMTGVGAVHPPPPPAWPPPLVQAAKLASSTTAPIEHAARRDLVNP